MHFPRINKPGGCAKITEIRYHDDGKTLKSYDVKYVVGSGWEKELDPALVFPFETLERGGRSRRGREFLIPSADKENKDISEKSNKRRKDVPCKDSKTKPDKDGTVDHSPPQASQATTTPTTPDRKPKSKAKRVTPIPSLVIAKDEVDISPLERLPMETTKPPPEASKCRRGLFDSPCDGGLGRSKRKKKDQKTNNGTVRAAACRTTAVHPPEPRAKPFPTPGKLHPCSTTTRAAIGEAKTAGSELAASSKAYAMKMNETSLSLSKRRNLPENNCLLDDKKAIDALSFPRPNRSDRFQNGTRVPLKDVYEEEVRRAKEFVQEVMNASGTDAMAELSREKAVSETLEKTSRTPEQSL